MGGFLGSILTWILDLFLKRKTPPAAERAGAAEQQVKAHEADQARVQAAADARDRVAAVSVRDGREAAARAPDKYSRD